MIVDPIDDRALFHALSLALGLFPVFQDEVFVEAVVELPRGNDRILAMTLSLMAVLMQGMPDAVSVFTRLDGLGLPRRCFASQSADIVIAVVDCARFVPARAAAPSMRRERPADRSRTDDGN